MKLSRLFIALLCLALPAFGQAPWAGILDSSRALDWTYAGVQGGIPSFSHICQAVSASGDTTGATDQVNINAALSSCAGAASASAPQVVLLEPGTFYSNASIGPPTGSSYIVLRGSGPDKTIVKWVGSSAACGHNGGIDLCFAGNSDSSARGETGWTGTNHVVGTYTVSSSVLDVTSTTNIVAGMVLILTQRNDSMGLCPQSGGTGNCSGKIGLSVSGGVATAVTSAPYADIVNGASVYIAAKSLSNYNDCGGYQSGGTPYVVSSVTTTATNTTFSYTPHSAIGTVNAACNPGYSSVDTGGVYTCELYGTCQQAGAGPGSVCPDAISGNQCASGEVSTRGQIESHIVTAVCTAAATPDPSCLAANEVVIDGQVFSPNWRTSQKPGVWWTGVGVGGVSNYVGVESLTIDALKDISGGLNPYATTDFKATSNFWMKNVRSLYAANKHLSTNQATRGSIVDSYFYGISHTGPNAYGIDAERNTSYLLVQNNITQHIGSAIIVEQAYGNVYGYNYQLEFLQAIGTGMNGMLNMNHGAAGAMLAEGNDSNGCKADNVHGPSWGVTFFRNRCRGQDVPARGTFLLAASSEGFQRVHNYIGNILGTTPFQTTYTAAQPPPLADAAIYALGAGGYVEGTGAPFHTALFDPLTVSTLMRWGNYDNVNAATKWDSTEVPTVGSTFINGNPVPADHVLPASFYLAAQPVWWVTPFGTPQWPPIGPDVTGGTAPDGLAGHADAIPAQLCYTNTSVDAAYQHSTLTITGATWSVTAGGQVVFTVSGSTTGYSQYDDVLVSGVSPSGYNGTWQIQSLTANTLTVLLISSDPGAYVSGGTAVGPNIRAFNSGNCYSTTGTPGASFNPPVITFTSQVVGTTSAGIATVLTNNGTATLTINSLALQTGTRFAISANSCGGTLTAGASCNVTITFTPNALGLVTDALILSSNIGPQSVALNGTGVGAPGPLPIALSPEWF